MRLLITRPLPEAVIKAASADFDVDVRDITTPMTRGEMIASLRDYDMVLPTLGDHYARDIFDAVPDPRCSLLANFGVGFNHIDVDAARACGISVTNTPGAVTDATADIAMTLMLMTCRRAGEGERMVLAGAWAGWHPTQLLGFHLSGKTVGIVGMGRIGQAIAQRCRLGFGMNVVYSNRSEKTVEGCVQLPSLNHVMATADIVVIAVPATPQTHHMINAPALSQMQAHSYLINIARGDIVDEAALIEALRDGKIAGAGLDVYEFEPTVPQALIEMENVTLLPHLGTAALEVRTDMGLMAVDNLIAHAKGQVPPNLL